MTADYVYTDYGHAQVVGSSFMQIISAGIGVIPVGIVSSNTNAHITTQTVLLGFYHFGVPRHTV